ncbi:putative FCP1 domain, HAD superfamily protein [Helianthus annuus]|nr:putative FCP1 domain, HAD superfamily protein [Helianthus annuus]
MTVLLLKGDIYRTKIIRTVLNPTMTRLQKKFRIQKWWSNRAVRLMRGKKVYIYQNNGSESKKDLNTEEGLNTEVAINHGCVVNEEKESLTKDIQIDDIDIEQETNKCKNEIVMEESQVDAPEAGGNEIRSEDNTCGGNGHPTSRKKLLVLDVNGLLVDIVANPDEDYKPDTILGSKSVFKRPFCDEFLKFCFERFNVGVWTSRTRNIEQVLKFLAVDTKQLLFCWDQFHCTKTGFNTIENSGKPLVLKELKKLWDKQDRYLPWYKGEYNESNTVFLDDSPYKALRNPPHTAIFPYSYSYRDTQDNGLGPNGDLRNYLERLAASDNVQKFIEQNPFGQQPITYDDESWSFYRKIIGSIGPTAGPSRSRKKLIVLDTGGLLVDLTTAPREGFKADTMHGSTSVFKRPYCDEFLQFCFKRFNVGFWTSTSRYNTECTLDFLMGDAQQKLLFYWDRSHSTDTGFGTVENNSKPLIVKELRKLWEKKDPDLPWDIGEYDESNTLLIENTSHRALLNPPHTGIFPYPYRYWNTEDNSLGPEGDLRVYLERLAESENVQKFVSENPFGQRPIREKNLSWKYYQKIIHAFSSRLKGRSNGSVDERYKKTSEDKPDTATALAAPTLAEPKADSTVSAAPTVLEPEIDKTIPDAQASLEPQPDTSMPDVQASLEPQTDTTIRDVQTALEPETDTTVPDAQTALKPETDTQTTLELETDTQTALEPQTDTQTALEPETDTTIPDAQTTLEPELDTDAQTAMEPEPIPTIPDAQTALEPQTDTTMPDAQPALEPQTDTTMPDAQPALEPQTDTTIPDAQTALEPETSTDAQTSLKPETDSMTVLAAQASLEPQTDTSTVSAAPN